MKNYYEYQGDRLPYGWDHPYGIPRDYDELYRTYGQFISITLVRYNKVPINTPDLLQSVWLQILNARLLQKFVERAARRLPLIMTGFEVAKFLGIRWQQWQRFLRNNTQGQCIIPLEGDRRSHLAVWETSTVCDVDYEQHFNDKRSNLKRKRPPVSNRGFKTYLQRSVHNAFANLCRTESRKHKERMLMPSTSLTLQSNGQFKQSSGIEGPLASWEENIAAAMTDEEGMIDVITCFRDLDIDLNGPEGVKIIDHMMIQGKREGGPQKNVELLGFLGDGYTLTEAIRKVRIESRLRACQ